MQRLTALLLAAACLAGCSNETTSVATAPTTTTPPSVLPGAVTGTVHDGPVTGAGVKVYQLQLDGQMGALKTAALSYPLPSPSPQLVTQMDGTGNTYSFSLSNSTSPVVVQMNGGNSSNSATGQVNPLAINLNLRAAIPTPVQGSVHVTPFTTIATELTLAQLRSGHNLQPQAVAQASNAAMAQFLGLSDLLSTSPIDPAVSTAGQPGQDSINYGFFIAGLAQEAQDKGLEPNSLIVALQVDARDGQMDGLEFGRAIFVQQASGATPNAANPATLQPAGTLPLSATALTSDLAEGVTRFAASPNNRSRTQPTAGVVQAVRNSSGRLAQVTPYQSPYQVNFTIANATLTSDFTTSPRGVQSLEALAPDFAQWFNLGSYGSNVADQQFGPSPREFTQPSPPSLPPGVTVNQWRRERVVASAMTLLGHYYQHHHIPDWNPSFNPNWPWSSVMLGMESAGIDCSDTSAWNYNFGLGIKLGPRSASLDQIAVPAFQAGITEAVSWDGTTTFNVTTILQTSDNGRGTPPPFEQFASSLQTGDLLYINSNPGTGSISHVIMWLGNLAPPGQEGFPLILDSHDNAPPVADSNGNIVPAGVRIRPFRPTEWYYKAFNRANRIIPFP